MKKITLGALLLLIWTSANADICSGKINQLIGDDTGFAISSTQLYASNIPRTICSVNENTPKLVGQDITPDSCQLMLDMALSAYENDHKLTVQYAEAIKCSQTQQRDQAETPHAIWLY